MHSIEIRQETASDADAIDSLHRIAFGGVAEGRLVEQLREGHWTEVALVAVRDRAILGHVVFSRAKIHACDRLLDVLVLAPLAVLPKEQRCGVGSRLTRAGLAACRERGIGAVLVLGHPDYYPRFGFSAELARPLHSPFGGGDAWMAVELIPGALTNIAGEVEFAPAFASLASHVDTESSQLG